ncbi:hypothetical protein GCM10010102_39170 [Promicromonospora citrea]|uniref:Uncharacterized protein n=1 Tax=Promicromonospora citrea TaxID=43677 RepID=A0A8H9GME8_9MICO|nr:hypothetical protein GCM10010102_39170 [Promicromonospora citrea]
MSACRAFAAPAEVPPPTATAIAAKPVIRARARYRSFIDPPASHLLVEYAAWHGAPPDGTYDPGTDLSTLSSPDGRLNSWPVSPGVRTVETQEQSPRT